MLKLMNIFLQKCLQYLDFFDRIFNYLFIYLFDLII